MLPGWQPAGNFPWNGTPFAFSLGGGGGAEAGQPANMEVTLTQPEGPTTQAVLGDPVTFAVCVYATKPAAASGATVIEEGAPVWRLDLPPISALPPGRGAEFTFSWNAEDLKGHPVPPGVYAAELGYPPTIAYTASGKTLTETVPTTPAEQQAYRELIFIGAPNPSYAEDPLIRALASGFDRTVYVPSVIPGNPRVREVNTVVPPPIPGVTPDNALREMITFEGGISEYLTTDKTPVPDGAPEEVKFTIDLGSAGGVPAAAYQEAKGYSATQGNVVTDQVVTTIGDLSIQLAMTSPTDSKTELIAIAKTLAAVPPVELAGTRP